LPCSWDMAGATCAMRGDYSSTATSAPKSTRNPMFGVSEVGCSWREPSRQLRMGLFAAFVAGRAGGAVSEAACWTSRCNMASHSTKPFQRQACDSWKKSNFARSILAICDAQLIEDFVRLDSFGSRPDVGPARQRSLARCPPFSVCPANFVLVSSGPARKAAEQKPHRLATASRLWRPGIAPALSPRESSSPGNECP
jgi:hypothetical protein